jgi:hypothetical protein
MPTEKLSKFLASEEFDSLIDKTDEFLKIDLKNETDKDIKVALFLENYFRERLSGSTLKNYAKQILDFLSDEEIDNILNFVQQNFFDLREQLWQEKPAEETMEESEKIEEIRPETFEEKEKRYQEIIAPLIKRISKPEEKKPIEEERIKTITFEPTGREKVQEPPETIRLEETAIEKLPETTIIIRKKEEGKIEEKSEDTVDLSRL